MVGTKKKKNFTNQTTRERFMKIHLFYIFINIIVIFLYIDVDTGSIKINLFSFSTIIRDYNSHNLILFNFQSCQK
jgi:hypothetical protein